MLSLAKEALGDVSAWGSSTSHNFRWQRYQTRMCEKLYLRSVHGRCLSCQIDRCQGNDEQTDRVGMSQMVVNESFDAIWPWALLICLSSFGITYVIYFST